MDERELLKHILVDEALVFNFDEQISDHVDPNAWLFDCRRILLKPRGAKAAASNLYTAIIRSFAETEVPHFQLATLEVGGIPLLTSLMHEYVTRTGKDLNTFFIRKSRKKSGLLRTIEGVIESNTPIILVDDLINSGDSLWKAVEELRALNHTPKAIWTLLRYRDLPYYQRFYERGIEIHSLFELNDLSKLIKANRGHEVQNLTSVIPPPPPWRPGWGFRQEGNSHNYVVQKSRPLLDEDLLFVGFDNETFYALEQVSGDVRWEFKTAPVRNHKAIFSNPALGKDLVLFGSYDGNFYALNKKDGSLAWKNTMADFIGSSPAVAEDLDLVFIGLEYGLWRKHGGIAALDLNTGVTVWQDSHTAFTHASPLYIPEYQMVVIGSNDGVLRAYEARSGKPLWRFTTHGSERYNPETHPGYSTGDIKEAPVYDPKLDLIVFGSIDGFLYVLERKTGRLVYEYECGSGVYSSPIVHESITYWACTDKNLRALDLSNGKCLFERNVDETRLMASPAIVNDLLLIGTNGGRLYSFDLKTGIQKETPFQAVERLTNTPVYNPQTRRLFVRTNINDVFCLEREDTKNK